ncbi:iron-sulfur cluster repair di-iron protein [Paenibacillus sp.]|uniref:iron-sulfur cluster repair di-iron protein n=1 Tax=Paenibacillus sp. TaxID=58172 RepID=UPI0028302B90|nr:iron-sulfur cluster repair di-iron protein [Paenibacillus sp.]MDR0267408.1 iron-sulfur cluster repair di-iron protein [Paenibacillus sp.]
MSQFTLQTQVSDIVTAIPQTADLFRTLRIDYCCGGKVPLEEATLKRNLDPETVLKQLEHIESEFINYQESRPSALTELEMIDYIQHKHHAFLRDELPAMTPYVTKLARVHGGHRPELLRVEEIFEELKQELLEHTADEEQNVFPLMAQYFTGNGPDHAASLKQQIAELVDEHEHAGNLLKELRDITSDFEIPVDACGTYRLVYQRLAHLEKDTFEHIHLENNILFKPFRTGL